MLLCTICWILEIDRSRRRRYKTRVIAIQLHAVPSGLVNLHLTRKADSFGLMMVSRASITSKNWNEKFHFSSAHFPTPKCRKVWDGRKEDLQRTSMRWKLSRSSIGHFLRVGHYVMAAGENGAKCYIISAGWKDRIPLVVVVVIDRHEVYGPKTKGDTWRETFACCWCALIVLHGRSWSNSAQNNWVLLKSINFRQA